MLKINRILWPVTETTNSLLCFRGGNSNLGAIRVGIILCLLLMVLFSGAELKAEMSYLNNGVIQIGVDINKGGSITFLADANQLGVNMINSHDLGRMVQESYYSGPVPFGDPHPQWANLGWNPICAGDCYGHVSEVVEYSNDGTTLYVKTIPKHWPLNNVPAECTFEKWITLDGNVAKVSCKLTNLRTDGTEQYIRGQELPAVYSTDRFYRIFSYTGEAPFTDGSLTQMSSSWPPVYIEATENWVALVDNDNWGLGVFHPEAQRFGVGFYGTPGWGNPTGGSTGYISPFHKELLDYNIVYRYDFCLIVGNLDAIRSYVYQHQPADSLPDYRFEQDRQHWAYPYAGTTTDTGWPINGKLRVNLDAADPQMIGPRRIWAAEDVPKLYIRASYNATCTGARIYWLNFGESSFGSAKQQTFAIIPDGQYRTYEVDLSSNPNYSGKISRLRFDPVDYGAPGEFVDIEYISYRMVGDFGLNGNVNLHDFAILASAWQSSQGDDNWNPACDISKPADGVIDFLDLAVFTRNWLTVVE